MDASRCQIFGSSAPAETEKTIFIDVMKGVKIMEIVITVEAAALAEAINNLAMALQGAKIPAQQQTAPAQTPVAPAPAPVQAPQPVPTPVAQPQQAPAPQPAPAQQGLPVAGVPLATAPKYTVEQIMAAGATLMDAGKANDLINLLHSFGVQAVMELKPEQLGAFATAMRDLGAKI